MLVSNLIDLITDIGRAADAVGEIGDDISDARNTAKGVAGVFSSRNYNSIKQVSKDLIATYPMLFSDSISIDTAYLVSNAFENEYTYLISLIINDSIIVSANSAKEVVSQFHRNITRYESYESDLKTLEEKLDTSILNQRTYPKVFIETEVEMNRYNDIKTADETIYKRDEVTGELKEVNVKKSFKPIQTSSVKFDSDRILAVGDRDIKKYNDLTPTIMKVSLNAKDKDLNVPITKEVAIGVKALIHKLPSSEIALNLSQAVKGSSTLFNLIRWTTGELKLVRDLILCVDQNKKFAKDSIKKDNFWWKKLDDMYRMNKIYKWLKVLNKNAKFKGPIPTATLVISKSDVDNIKSMYGIDLLNNTSYALKIFNKLSLLTFAIVDESVETLYVFDENSKFYSMYPFRSIKVKKATDGQVNIEDLKPLFKR